MQTRLAAAAIGGLILVALNAAPASAAMPMLGHAIAAPSLVQEAACHTIRERVRRHGRVIYRTVRRCGPGFSHWRGCRVKHVRTVRPNGRIVYKTVRRCG